MSGLQKTKISLPFITTSDDGPLHIEEELNRKLFESLSEDLLDRLLEPVQIALEDSGWDPDKIDEVKDIVLKLLEDNLKEAKQQKQVFRPWGSYISIADGLNWQVKKISVNPGASLSLQKHIQIKLKPKKISTQSKKTKMQSKKIVKLM